MGEMEVKGLRRQKASSGGNAVWLSPATHLPQQLTAARPHAAQPKLQHCRPSCLLDNEDIWERAGCETCPALPAERSSCFASHQGTAPAGEGRRNSQSSAVIQPPLNPFFPTFYLHCGVQSPRFWPEGGAGMAWWEEDTPSALHFHREYNWSSARDVGQSSF